MAFPWKDPKSAVRFLGRGLLAAAFVLVATECFPAAGREPAADECDSTTSAPAPQGLRLQHLLRLGVDRWHAAGHLGKGVKVAILDSGFRNYRSQLGHSLPRHVKVRSFREDGNLEARDSQHGILCGEVIHALAPEAELLFANWEPDQPEQFLAAVHWAKEQGARIVSCSVIMPSWSDGEGGGRTHGQLSRLVGNGQASADPLFFASAGNTAERHWCGTFRDDGQGFHLWNHDQTANRLQPWGLDRVSVELCWSSPTVYELVVFDRDTGTEVGRCLGQRLDQHASASVHFVPKRGRSYEVRVRHVRGTPGKFHMVSLAAGLEYATLQGSIPFPADGAEVVAVGAVDEDGKRFSYSSCGPNSRQIKPDLVASVPFPSTWRTRPFGGTSAAAPQAAALAGLWWSRYPAWTADQVRTALRKSAHDVGPPGPDFETGYGLIRLPWARLAALERELTQPLANAALGR